MSDLLLNRILQPLKAFYDNPQIVEVRMATPKQVILETRDRAERLRRLEAPDLTHRKLVQICRVLANMNGLQFDDEDFPKISTVLPGGHRFECALGASIGTGLSLAIRCKHPFRVSFEDMGLDTGQVDFLLNALADQQNIAISGSTNTGKTTLLNAFLRELPDHRRVVAAEDTLELDVERFWNGVSLRAARDKAQGAGLLSWDELYDHKMRISPDNILFGEISTQNAAAALNVLNTGARGWMCTVHAEGPEMLAHRFDANIKSAGKDMGDVDAYLRDMLDLVVHIKRSPEGRRYVSDIYNMKAGNYLLKDKPCPLTEEAA